MAFIQKEFSMIISSDADNGAINKSSDGSRFEIQLENGLEIPKGAHNVTIQVENATIWNSVPNIITNVNDRITINGLTAADVEATYVITFPQGLYNLSQLNSSLEYQLRDAGGKFDPLPMVNFTADEATNKVEMHVNYDGVQVDFSAARTIGQMLGFNSGTYGDYANAPDTILANNVATLNNVDYFLIHSDLTNLGMRVNNKYYQTIAQVLIDVAPGSQIISQPNHPPKIECPHLVGNTRSHIRFWLTNHQNEAVNTSGENYSMRLVFKYELPFVLKK